MSVEHYFSTPMDLMETTLSDFVENVSANATVEDHKNPTLQLYDILIPAIGAVAIVLNLAVVISSGLILKKDQQPKSTYLFLGNVALTDFFTAVSTIFGQTFPKEYRDHYVCSTQLGMIVSCSLASIFSVGLIAIDRYLYILHGLQYQRWISPRKARIFIAFTWILGCLVGFLPLLGWHGNTYNGKRCWFIILSPKGHILLCVALGGAIVFTVITLYGIILYHSMRNIFRLRNAESGTNISGLRMFKRKSTQPEPQSMGFRKFISCDQKHKIEGPNKWRAIKVVIFTCGCFLVTWGPYFIAAVVYVYTTDKVLSDKLSILIASPLAILGFSNTLLNPVIYAWWHNGFRKFVKRLVHLERDRRNTESSTLSKTTASSQFSNTSLNKLDGDDGITLCKSNLNA